MYHILDETLLGERQKRLSSNLDCCDGVGLAKPSAHEC
jgi:hypothetical protein